MLIEVRFLRDGKPRGAAYTYDSGGFDVSVGDKVTLPSGNGVVVAIGIPEESVEAIRDKIKAITGKVEEGEELNASESM